MKKIISIIAASLLMLSLAACGSSGGKTGTYSAIRSEAFASEYGHGWQDTLTVVYEKGKIKSATFDAVFAVGEDYEIGTKKSSLTPETYPMTPPVSEWIPVLEENIVKGGSSDKIDAVAGATYAHGSAVELLKAIEEKGEDGQTIEVP